MTKTLKLSYIFLFIFSAILLAWKTLSNFFGGVAINFIALVGLVLAIFFLSFQDREMFNRIKDLFFIACGFCVLELVIYFACEYGYGELLLGFSVYQNIISFLGILFLAYICFRFVGELKGKKVKFVEILLGNQKMAKKEKSQKKAKEITNGSLEEKPNQKLEENGASNVDHKEDETVVIIETEE